MITNNDIKSLAHTKWNSFGNACFQPLTSFAGKTTLARKSLNKKANKLPFLSEHPNDQVQLQLC